MKRGKMTVVEKCFIENNLNMDAEEIATNLDRSVKTVAKWKSELADKQEKSAPMNENEERTTGVHSHKGGHVLTSVGSELVDANRKMSKPGAKSSDYIHRPKG